VRTAPFWDKAGAAEWIIEGQTTRAQLMGMIITPGGPEDHSSFCSELAGIYGVLLTLEALAIPPNMACLVD